MNQDKALSYEDVIARVDGDEFFSLFERLRAEPRWVTSNGKPSIQLLGLCHGGSHHSALFDPATCKVHCFSECGCGMYLHTWVGKVTEEFVPENVRDNIKEYFTDDDHPLNLTARTPKEGVELGYTERPFERRHINKVPGIKPEYLEDIARELQLDNSLQTLGRTSWCLEDGIKAEILQEFGVAYRPASNKRTSVINGKEYTVCDRMATIILPHHNIDGEVVGIYERSFDMLRREAKQQYGDWMTWSQIASFPRAKYVPLLKLPQHLSDDGKTSYSFPNSSNLYGLHKAAKAIKETGTAIIFEGAKSVMLAHQWGRKQGVREWETAVASHTFGAHVNHINMLLDLGAKNIYLGFDKQYQEMEGAEWVLYDKKTRELAHKVEAWAATAPNDVVGHDVKIYRLRDPDKYLSYKDAPVDKGPEIFGKIFENAESITGEDAVAEVSFGTEITLSEGMILRRDEALRRIQEMKTFADEFGKRYKGQNKSIEECYAEVMSAQDAPRNYYS